ncbi:MAG: M4 family metallopeptidase [Planctomycetes bacterium]|nr:M4 family metallopeptidase [Planctomycetota bacterium]MBI3833951.1 M4 family metallopeptidase [Planctomycetota bacterium]
MSDGGPIPVHTSVAGAAVSPLDLVKEYKDKFGIDDPDAQLMASNTRRDDLGWTHTNFQQIHHGVPVFGGVIKTHQNANGEFISANGHFLSVPSRVSSIPKITRAAAERIAANAMNDPTATAHESRLEVVDPAWYGNRPKGAHLAYFLRMADAPNTTVEGFFIDAHTGEILDRWNLVETAKNRQVHDAAFTDALPGPLTRSEGNPASGNIEVDRAYDYSGDMFDFYFRMFGRNSVNDAGLPLVLTVNSTAPTCPNAFWNGEQAVFCNALTIDDVVAHELTHGIVQFTADLIYLNQPGQLNESYADVFGELVDLFNGNGAFVGVVGPPWPVEASGPGLDTPNLLRTDECVGGTALKINSPANIAGLFTAGQAFFGPALSETGLTGNLARATPALGCSALTNGSQISGKIAVIDRGSCTFSVKVKNAQNVGAIGVLIVNNVPGGPPGLGGSDPTVTIPCASIDQTNGQAIIDELAQSHVVNATMKANGISGGVRWLVAEGSAPQNAFRDMWRPTCKAHPDRANHSFQTCDPNDNGGVHSGSGVPNHAFALVTDGGSFNGFNVIGIGAIKSAAVWYRALTIYLSASSDFQDAYAALNQAANDLVGSTPLDPRTGLPSSSAFSAQDALQVDLTLQAVEMNTQGLCGAVTPVLDSNPPVLCGSQMTIFSDDFEHGTNGWTVSNTNPPFPFNWTQVTNLPDGHPGIAWFIADPDTGDCVTDIEAAVHFLTSPTISIPAGADPPIVTFTHYVATEAPYDGGNLRISVNGAAFALIPGSAFSYNQYNATLTIDNSDDPLAGQEAFTGFGGTWGTSVIDLTGIAGAGDLIRIQFEFGKDGCGGLLGWFVSDFKIFSCVPAGNGDFDANGHVEMRDFAAMQNCFNASTSNSPECAPGELNGDQLIDLADHALFVGRLNGP